MYICRCVVVVSQDTVRKTNNNNIGGLGSCMFMSVRIDSVVAG